MALTSWSGFYDYIMPHLQGVQNNLVDLALRNVCIDFCQQTGIHLDWQAAQDIVGNTANYNLSTAVTGCEVYQVKTAWADGKPLAFAPLDALNSRNTYWRDETAPAAEGFTQEVPNVIVLWPTPTTDVTNGLIVLNSLCPTRASTGLTDWIASRYMDALANGAVGQLMAMPAKPWTDPATANFYTTLYEAAKTRATIDVNRSLTRGALSATLRPAA